MSRQPQQEPYYNDEGIMDIVSYNTYDYSQPKRGEDLTNPNATTSTSAIVDESPTRVGVEQSIFVSERYGPLFIDGGNQFEVLNLTEAGELVSIEIVTDNPYLAVYLQLDDYKNKEPNGITPAELLLRGRDEYSEREFYVEDRRPDGMYVIKYHPRNVDEYHDVIRLLLRNDLRRQKLFGAPSSFVSRSGLPTPKTLDFAGGSTFEHKAIGGQTGQDFSDTRVSEIMQYAGGEEYKTGIINPSVLLDRTLLEGEGNPYTGTAGLFNIERGIDPATGGETIVWGESGEKIISGTGSYTPAVSPTFPGNGYGVYSEQQIVIYNDSTEDQTAAVNGVSGVPFARGDGFKVGDPLLIWDGGDTLYFPGEIVSLQQFVIGTSTWTDINGDAIAPIQGAIAITVKPGLGYKPPNMYVDVTTAVSPQPKFYLPSARDANPKILVKEITVRRRRKKYLQE